METMCLCWSKSFLSNHFKNEKWNWRKEREREAHDENSLDVRDQELWLLESLLWRFPPETCHILRQEVRSSVELIRAHFAQKRALLHDGNAQRDFGTQFQGGRGGRRGAWFNGGHGGGCRGRAGSYASLAWHDWSNSGKKKEKGKKEEGTNDRCGMTGGLSWNTIPHVISRKKGNASAEAQ